MNADRGAHAFEGREAVRAAIEENERMKADEAGAAEATTRGLSRRNMLRNLGGAAAVGAGAAVVGGIAAPNLALAAAGDIIFLARPIRLYDTRRLNAPPFPPAAAKLASADKYELQVTGTVVDTLSVPNGAAGVIGTLTVTQTENSGYLTVYPTGIDPVPTTSNINWFGSNQNLATLVISALSGTGKMTIHNGIAGAATSDDTHVVFDAAGYIAG